MQLTGNNNPRCMIYIINIEMYYIQWSWKDKQWNELNMYRNNAQSAYI